MCTKVCICKAWESTHLKHSFQHSQGNQCPHTSLSSERSQQCQCCCHHNTNTKHVLGSEPRSQPSTGDLHYYIAVKEGGKYPTCILRKERSILLIGNNCMDVTKGFSYMYENMYLVGCQSKRTPAKERELSQSVCVTL